METILFTFFGMNGSVQRPTFSE